MKEITLHNKNFTIFIDDNEINSIISALASKIEKTDIEKPLFIAILIIEKIARLIKNN